MSIVSMDLTSACICCWPACVYWNIGSKHWLATYTIINEYHHVNVSEQFEINTCMF